MLQVLVAGLRQRGETVVDDVLLSILVDPTPLPELFDEALVHPVNLEEGSVAESVLPVSVAIIHDVVVDRGFYEVQYSLVTHFKQVNSVLTFE